MHIIKIFNFFQDQLNIRCSDHCMFKTWIGSASHVLNNNGFSIGFSFQKLQFLIVFCRKSSHTTAGKQYMKFSNGQHLRDFWEILHKSVGFWKIHVNKNKYHNFNDNHKLQFHLGNVSPPKTYRVIGFGLTMDTALDRTVTWVYFISYDHTHNNTHKVCQTAV